MKSIHQVAREYGARGFRIWNILGDGVYQKLIISLRETNTCIKSKDTLEISRKE